MYLLNTRDLRLEEFFEGSVPEYAILSHTWAEEEVRFKDMADLAVAKIRKGWQKIACCCRRALDDGYAWVWIDTCCVDKSSSAELSEAVNSMWLYDRQAQLCYVYLADVRLPTSPVVAETDLLTDERLRYEQVEQGWLEKLVLSRWFTRGWTLQELLAPNQLLFFTQDWSALGRKRDLAETIEAITKIKSSYLCDWSSCTASIACKMSWAANRKTTRTEDMAYCFLGIFDVNMPLLYGEGKKAFRRLQMELVSSTTDESIFAWKCDSSVTLPNGQLKSLLGVLADSPSQFADCGGVSDDAEFFGVATRTVANAGIRLRSQLLPLPLFKTASKYKYDGMPDFRYIPLACWRLSEEGVRERVGIAVRVVGQMLEREDPKPPNKRGNQIPSAIRAFPDYVHQSRGENIEAHKTVYLRLD